MADYTYRTDQAGPAIGFRWLDYTGALIDFSGGWTYELEVVSYAGLVVKVVANADISGSAGSEGQPNIVINFATGFFTTVPVAQYMLVLKATQTSTSKMRIFSLDRLPTLEVVPAPTPAP